MVTELKKKLNAFELTLFGTGTIIGAGIYVLVGKIAGIAGFFTPLSFILAAIIALFTALSYAQLSSVFPKTASAVVYVDNAFSNKILSATIGYLLLITLIITSATIVKGFAGYMQMLIVLPETIIVIGILLVLAAVAIKGITESVWLIGTITLIEIGGLIFVIVILRDAFSADNMLWLSKMNEFSFTNLNSMVSGAFLAFFAFVGFEGIANIAEETKQPLRAIPGAIISSLAISTSLYLLIAFVCLGSMSINDLSVSSAPMADLMQTKGTAYSKFISIISLIAVINGVMSMIIMGARVLFGMVEKKLIPNYLFHVHQKYQTPDRATIVMIVLLFLLTLVFSILSLANAASFIILIVFSFVNLSLVVLKLSGRMPKRKTLRLSVIFPMIGFLLCVAMLAQQLMTFFTN